MVELHAKVFWQLGFVAAAFLTSASLPANGAMDSGGADHVEPEQYAAWFAEDRAIHYCIERAASFPFQSVDLREQVDSAFTVWLTKLETSGRNRTAPQLATVLIWEPECGDSVDLTFYFGDHHMVHGYYTQSPRVQAVAVPVRRSRAHTWTAGYIYVKSNDLKSNDPSGLYALILHEIGHVFGVGHVPGTIMDANILAALGIRRIDQGTDFIQPLWSEEHKHEIDHQYSILPNTAAANGIGKIIRIIPKFGGSETKTVSVPMDQGPLTLSELLPVEEGLHGMSYDIGFVDWSGHTKVFTPSEIKSPVADHRSIADLVFFAFERDTEQTQLNYAFMVFEKFVAYGRVLSEDGTIQPGVYSKNMNNVQHEIQAFFPSGNRIWLPVLSQ